MAFTEREAMKLRLQQIDNSEKRTLLLFKEERELIFKRLRELDNLGVEIDTTTNNQSQKNIVDRNNSSTRIKRVGRPKKEAKLTYEDEVAIYFLKHQTAAISGADIMQEIYKKTGKNIRNTTHFMTNLMKLDPCVKKPYRGQYTYEGDDLKDKKELLSEEK
ncbi:hypothetical protein [Bacillus bombysepticus]|uniref:Rok-like winged helix domain-containing protein n=1 Tax=Bacillus bombysepticus TaxID=658666 RepID=UPI003019589C